MNFEIAERRYDINQDDYFYDLQSKIERIAEKRAELVEFQVTEKSSEYYFLEPSNLMEAITESGMSFQVALGKAVQAGDAIEVLSIINKESKLYWTQYLNTITE
jgi:hypothetical protein